MAGKGSTKDGIRAMIALGYTQADYARMFNVDSATINQWYRYGRVGARTVGRVEMIPELKGKLSIATLRPDLDADGIAEARAIAKLWKPRVAKKAVARPAAVSKHVDVSARKAAKKTRGKASVATTTPKKAAKRARVDASRQAPSSEAASDDIVQF